MTPVNRRVFQEPILLLAAFFAVFWAILRACLQSVTIDEADTYLFFASRSARFIWYPSSNNHVLNSLLMWMTTHFLGPAAITVRAPALLGAIGYIGLCYFFCRTIAPKFSLCLPLFICLTYNSLILDFLVAARGHGLADALLLAAVAAPVWHRVKGGPIRNYCLWASLALGLSFASNFSFAFVDLSAFAAIFAWAIRRRGKESVARIAGFCALPGLAVALALCGYPLAHWRSNDTLGASALSLGDMARDLVHDSLYRLDPRFARSGLYVAMNFLRPLLAPALLILCLCQLVVTRIEGAWLFDEHARWLGRLGAALGGIAALSLLMHWLAFRFLHLPLPLGRKGMYLVTLATLMAGILAAAPVRSRASRWLQRGITAALVCLACYFVLCLRLTYFEEWKWDADVKDVYSVLARYNHKYGVADVGTSWYYTSSLNFYRVASRSESFPEFRTVLPDPPENKTVYVLNRVFDRKFLDKEKLVIVYRGTSTDVVIAVRPEAMALGWKKPRRD